ncbi:universal stress protein [Hafnia alvei]|uniref:universal stress protein n=1 Tax=Hafnia alvei TaxID=569 RepID=UPI00103542CB|nr:universal stress protein [Hafnia alvei]MEB7889788.1 universal stress protein [Hafnia alvei]TBL47984.1 universal stress protein UspA [Obesumbacterium proteus]TBL90052.1 universal stress protein UspA [Hafnia alvei]
MYKTILVPIDLDEDTLISLAAKHVEDLAEQNDARIHFVSVIPSYQYAATLSFAFTMDALDESKVKDIALTTLKGIVSKFNISEDRIEHHIISGGTPKDQILKLAENLNADLIIIGSNRPSIATYLIGSNAAAIVRHAKCSVLVAR